MKLLYSKTSPFARKVFCFIIEHQLEDKFTLDIVSPIKNPDVVSAVNPLGKIPCLITDQGEVIIDSPIICKYIDLLAKQEGKPTLLESNINDAFTVEKIQSMADGIMDSAVALVMEKLREEPQQSAFWKERWINSIYRMLDHLEHKEITKLHDESLTLAQLAVACALGYLDFRLPDLHWQRNHSQLAQWFETISARESLRRTIPVE